MAGWKVLVLHFVLQDFAYVAVGTMYIYIKRKYYPLSFCCLTSTEARRPIRLGDKWEKGDRRVKPRNIRRPPRRPRLPWTAARKTEC